MPVVGRDYPRNWSQFLKWFSDADSCARYLERLRWPDGFACPSCGVLAVPYRASRGRLVCRSCRHQSSVTAGTIFAKTRTPLPTWFAAAWYVCNQKHGVSALGLQRALGLGSYQTAWMMLHRLRRAMVRSGRERLHGEVEVDETFIGGQKRGVGGRDARFKHTVVIAVELRRPRGFGRVRLRRVDSTTERELVGFVRECVEPRSIVYTDGWIAYKWLWRHGYEHEVTVMSDSRGMPHESMPGVHRVAALLKRWLLGTHQGATRADLLDAYLEEFTFRFNRRSSRSRGLLFYRLLEQAVTTPPATYDDVAARRDHKMSGSVELNG